MSDKPWEIRQFVESCVRLRRRTIRPKRTNPTFREWRREFQADFTGFLAAAKSGFHDDSFNVQHWGKCRTRSARGWLGSYGKSSWRKFCAARFTSKSFFVSGCDVFLGLAWTSDRANP